MDGDTFGRVAYLVLLLVAVGGWFVAEARGNLGKSVRQALVWGLIFLGIIAAYGLWGDIRREVVPSQARIGEGKIEVPMSQDGHFYLNAKVNGQWIDFVVDTGASDIVLTSQDAKRVGIDVDNLAFIHDVLTANGSIKVASTTVDTFEVSGVSDSQVVVVVNPADLDISLLGMSYLRRYARVEISGGSLILER